ncbi:GPW/gp25 family protein [Terrabacter sp. MAHUQ-38]|jgi:phage baseplate assembly protein W|uniref:GPW/gp25 family protein n=1 Tax=unclassified Terrabacter TaxID=2630222 RepID=UPI00165DAF69|nr:GPW/gp25 family protein [Terrabacter sp. MAHUQ-38]MBC9819860.1 GPW/gp25 family protein [Terrabacter sp. MAHUQ-38]
MSTGDYPQVGRGWAFPPRWQRTGEEPTSEVAVVTNDGAEHVGEALVLLLRTMLGSRVMRPDLGAGVDRYVFEPRTSDACHRLADDVRRALVLGEPRVIVDAVEAVPAGEADDRVDVTIEFRIDRHRRPTSLVVPFYLAGAS